MVLLQAIGAEHWLYNSTVILLLGLAFLAGFIWWGVAISKKHEKPFGEVVSLMAVKHNESYITIFMILTFMFSGLLAASITPEGETPPNPLTRFGVHILISGLGAVCAVTLVRDFGSIFERGIDFFSRLIRIVIVAVVGYVSVWVPFLNASIIAGGLNEDVEYQLYLYSVNPLITQEQLRSVYMYYGKDSLYSPWAALSYNMQAEAALVWVGLLAAFIEGLRNLASKERRGLLFPAKKKEGGEEGKKKEGGEEKDKDKSAEEADTAQKKAEENIKWLLRRMGYAPGDSLDRLVKAGKEALYSLKNSEDRIHLSVELGKLVNEGRSLDANTSMPDDEKNQKKADLKNRIRARLTGKPKDDKDKRGLGLTLKSQNK